MKISVVIPTLGGSQLKETIVALQKNTIIPDEILLCIPEQDELLININSHDNIKIIKTHRRGQVYQRMIGFLAARGELVLQIDDDIIIENNAIEQLAECISKSDKKLAVAPTYLKIHTNMSIYERNNASIFWRIIYRIANGKNGFIPGIVSLSGVNFGLNFNNDNFINKSEWLPGGCIMHRRENLIIKDYFPFDGKAYGEDLIHSFLLRKAGVGLYVCKDAIAYADRGDGAESLSEFFKQYKVVKYIAILFKKSLIRMRVYYIINFIFFFAKKLKNIKK